MNFKEVYKDAAREIVQPNIDAHSVLDEVRRRRVRKRQMIQKAATVASMLLVIGIGGITTTKAAGYLGSVIRVGEHGFVSGDVYTMTDTVPGFEENDDDSAMSTVAEAKIMPEEGIPDAPVHMNIEDVPMQQFDSVEAFLAECQEIVIALPDLEVSEDGFESVQVVGESVFVRYQVSEEKSVDIHRHDYSDSQGHTASVAFPGEICNERSYTTEQGFVYTLIDEVRLSEEEPMRIHGAISVECYEVYVNFYGFAEAEVTSILEGIDLGIYCE